MNIAIVGGGIGGLTVALALRQRGIPCRVFESAPVVRELGVGITLLPHALRELTALGLGDTLTRQGVENRESCFLYPRGSNGAAQVIIGARTLADRLANGDDPRAALLAYEAARAGPTAPWSAPTAIIRRTTSLRAWRNWWATGHSTASIATTPRKSSGACPTTTAGRRLRARGRRLAPHTGGPPLRRSARARYTPASQRGEPAATAAPAGGAEKCDGRGR